MRTVIILVLIVAGVVGLGWYRGWFQFSSGSQDNKADITVSVDKDKIRADKDKVVEKLRNLEQKAKDKIAVTTQKSQN